MLCVATYVPDQSSCGPEKKMDGFNYCRRIKHVCLESLYDKTVFCQECSSRKKCETSKINKHEAMNARKSHFNGGGKENTKFTEACHNPSGPTLLSLSY